MIPAFFAISNPLALDIDAGAPEHWTEVILKAPASGFDGISYPNEEEADEDVDTGERVATKSWVAFFPSQIVSAIGVDRSLLAEAIAQLHADGVVVVEEPADVRSCAASPLPFEPTQNPMETALPAGAPPANPSSNAVSPIAIEYVTRDLFKGKSLRAASKSFFRKFNGWTTFSSAA